MSPLLAASRDGATSRSFARWTAALGTASLAVVVSVQAIGWGGRHGGQGQVVVSPFPTIVVAPTPAAAVAAWQQRGLRGRVLVHFGRFLHFVPDDGVALLRRELRAPGSGHTADVALAARADRPDYLWTAASLGVARRISYVSPPQALASRAASLPDSGAVLPAHIDWEAFPRTIDRVPPRLTETVLLDVHASWFDERTGDDLLGLLAAAGLRADVVTVVLAEGSSDVSHEARTAARAFAARLREPGVP